MEQHDGRLVPRFEARFQNVHPDAIAIVDETGTDGWREDRLIIGFRRCRPGWRRLSASVARAGPPGNHWNT